MILFFIIRDFKQEYLNIIIKESQYEEMSENRTRQQSNNDDLFTNFQNIVHLAEDSKSNHVFVVMGASVIN